MGARGLRRGVEKVTISALARDKRDFVQWLEEAEIEVVGVSTGPRGSIKVSMLHGAKDREKLPAMFRDRPVIVQFHESKSVARLGASPAFPETIHRVRQAKYKGGGWVATWKCERGRGEVYGAVLMTEMPMGAVMCAECLR